MAQDTNTVAPSTDKARQSARDTAAGQRSGKGRPTPRRSESQRRRTPVKAPETRREAAREYRRRLKEERGQTRQALVTGDQRALPRRDAGPVRQLVRDIVDARRNAGGLFFFGAILVFVLSLSNVELLDKIAFYLFLALWALVITDSIVLSRYIKAAVKVRFPEDDGRGHALYGIMRALQIRKLRLPKPHVNRGDKI